MRAGHLTRFWTRRERRGCFIRTVPRTSFIGLRRIVDTAWTATRANANCATPLLRARTKVSARLAYEHNVASPSRAALSSPKLHRDTRHPTYIRMRALATDSERGKLLPLQLSKVILSFRVAPPGTVAPWQTLAAARPLRRTWQVPHRPFCGKDREETHRESVKSRSRNDEGMRCRFHHRNGHTLQSNLTLRPAREMTLPRGSPCFALTTLLPFCGKVHSTVPLGCSFAFAWRPARRSCLRSKSASRALFCP